MKAGRAIWFSLVLTICAAAGICAAADPLPPFARADDGQWTLPAKNTASTRFSTLAEINPANASRLRLDFTFKTGLGKGEEAAPLVVGNTMYIVTPYPNTVYALDLTKPGAVVKWRFDPHPAPASQGVACCDVINRGGAYADGKLVFNTLDGQTIALNATTGKLLWRTQLGNIKIGETITMAPLIARDKVLVGDSGGEFGVRGWIAALNLADGKIAWKAFNTGPDKDVLIGPSFRPFYAKDRGKDLGVSTWVGDEWKTGGGNVWGWVSYDPDLNLVYYGTGNPGPWNAEQRPGNNEWTAGIFARDLNTGQARWYYQWSPHDIYDHDGVNENILLDLHWRGQPRKVLVHPERNGYVYVLDRTTGEVLSAKPFVFINSSRGVDLKTGELLMNPAKKVGTDKTTYDICPTASGAKDWEPSAYSPRTGLLYIPHANLCMDEHGVSVSYIPGTPYVGADLRQKEGRGGHRGAFTAWDVLGQKKSWEVQEPLPVWSGAVVTAGDVVFYGTLDGWFKAVGARSGKLLWRYKTDSGIISQPVVYRGPDGHEYVAVLSGIGGWIGMVISNNMDARDKTGALGMVSAAGDLVGKVKKAGTLYVFRLR
ncbi:MAG TPA: PQQ-dependent dehydrogenase, methanol/ethanol family [Caulobacteraceae bacterium]|nr:PQQ-dependent dehydrogenase, methanol/ethanol family [Caulobacteraceae bacterium]